jgi:hypothetical protein
MACAPGRKAGAGRDDVQRRHPIALGGCSLWPRPRARRQQVHALAQLPSPPTHAAAPAARAAPAEASEHARPPGLQGSPSRRHDWSSASLASSAGSTPAMPGTADGAAPRLQQPRGWRPPPEGLGSSALALAPKRGAGPARPPAARATLRWMFVPQSRQPAGSHPPGAPPGSGPDVLAAAL